MKAPRSLEARALGLLAQRDRSRVELRRRLLRHAGEQAAAGDGDVSEEAVAASGGDVASKEAVAAGGGDVASKEAVGAGDGNVVSKAAVAAQVDALLDRLEQHGYLSDARFVESRVLFRAERFGTLRIRAELAQHGLELSPEAKAALAQTELERAAAVRQKRFAALPRDAKERAAQMRFLAARGFSSELIQRLLR